MKDTRAARLLRAAEACLVLSLSTCATPRHAAEPPPDRLPAWARQAIVVRPTRGFHATLTAWERAANGWHRTAGPWPAVIGRNGFAPWGEKREGDGRTPSGVFRLGLAFGRPLALPTGLEYRQATGNDYWVDDPASPLYNRWVQGRPAGVSCEKMLLSSGLYDAGIVIEYNTAPIVPGRGSAIFVHIWDGDGQKATAGCVALDRARLTDLLRRLDAKANPVIALGSALRCQPARGCEDALDQDGQCPLERRCHLGAQEMRFLDLDRQNADRVGHRQAQLAPQGQRFAYPQEVRRGVRQRPKVVSPDFVDLTRGNGPPLDRVDQDQSAVAADVIQQAQSHLLGFLDVNLLIRTELAPDLAHHAQPDRVVAENVIPQTKNQNALSGRLGLRRRRRRGVVHDVRD